jgi:hypothetical protein
MARTDKTDNGEINWYEEEVRLIVQDASDAILTALAFQGEAYAKVHVQENGQIDTGFMLNSIYGFGPEGDRRAAALGEALAKAVKDFAPPIKPEDERGGGIHAAAEYAIYQEMKNSFLYRALEDLVKITPNIVIEVGKKVVK